MKPVLNGRFILFLLLMQKAQPDPIHSNQLPNVSEWSSSLGFPALSTQVFAAAPCFRAVFRRKHAYFSTNFVDKCDGRLPLVKKIHDLPTPCLVVELDRFEANLEKMSRFTRERRIALRPHSKTHKCVNI